MFLTRCICFFIPPLKNNLFKLVRTCEANVHFSRVISRPLKTTNKENYNVTMVFIPPRHRGNYRVNFSTLKGQIIDLITTGIKQSTPKVITIYGAENTPIHIISNRQINDNNRNNLKKPSIIQTL